MDAETSRDEASAGAGDAARDVARRGEPAREGALDTDAALDDALLRRLDRIVGLAARRDEPALQGELLDELRGLVRAAEQLHSPARKTEEEVVERPARRLHGT